MARTDVTGEVATISKIRSPHSKLILKKTGDATSSQVLARPFLKWAGGKTQLLEQFEHLFPDELKEGKIRKYFEPFVGSGAVFFHIMGKYGKRIESALLCDINDELILLYKVIQRDVDELVSVLDRESKSFSRIDMAARAKKFQHVRETFNKGRSKLDFSKYSRDWIPRAAHFIFLNKTCYNGLFRVNKSGEFNTPFGKYTNPRILDEPNLLAVSSALSIAECRIADFAAIKSEVTRSSFVYFDPPYRPISDTSYFTSYSKSSFGDPEQVRLATFYRDLSEKKHCKLMLSNSDPQNHNHNDHFFVRLYSGFRIERVDANRMINCQAGKRGKIKELLILNY